MADLISGLVFIVLSGAVFTYALQLPAGRGNAPGPGFFPELAAIVGILVGTAICVRAVIALRARAARGDGGAPQPETRGDILRFIGVLGVSTVYLMTLKPLGFLIASALLLAANLLILGERRVLVLLLVPTALTGVVLLIFTTLLGLRLPAGTLF